MEQWIEIAGKFGIPVVMLGMLGYFLLKHVWPFVTRQIEAAQAERKIEVDKFVETIRARDVMMAEIQERNLKALEGLASKIDGKKFAKVKRR